MAIHLTLIRHTVTATARTFIHTMGGTIPGLGTATASMDTHTIGNQSTVTKPIRPSTYRARLRLSH